MEQDATPLMLTNIQRFGIWLAIIGVRDALATAFPGPIERAAFFLYNQVEAVIDPFRGSEKALTDQLLNELLNDVRKGKCCHCEPIGTQTGTYCKRHIDEPLDRFVSILDPHIPGTPESGQNYTH